MIFKKQSDILRSMMEYSTAITEKISDYTVGSALRTIYDAVSIEAEMIYMLMNENIEEGIETGLLSSFDFEPREASRAYGDVTLTFYNKITTSFVIPRGTRFRSVDTVNYPYVYETIVDYQVPTGTDTVMITVHCIEEGIVGNIPKGELNRSEGSLFNLDTVTNKEDILTGSDEETYEEQRKRFLLFIESIGRGTRSALEYGALVVPGIEGVYVDEKVGTSYVYCHDKNGNLPDKLRQQVIASEENYRSAGIELRVEGMKRYDLNLNITIVATDPSLMTMVEKDNITNYIRNYINSFKAGQDFILAEFIQSVMNYDDSLIYDCFLTNVGGNIIIDKNQLIRTGELSIEFE